MNMNLMRAAVAACFMALIPNVASAFYAAHMGRWTSRDPLIEIQRIGATNSRQTAAESTFIGRDINNYGTALEKWQESPDHQLQNLYECAGSDPLNRTDPSGLMFGFSYGKYCGLMTAGPGVPIDSLDRACQAHDSCLATAWQFVNPCMQMYCNSILCDEAKKAVRTNCKADWPGNPTKQQQCETAAMQVAGFMCATSLQSSNPYPDISPWHPPTTGNPWGE